MSSTCIQQLSLRTNLSTSLNCTVMGSAALSKDNSTFSVDTSITTATVLQYLAVSMPSKSTDEKNALRVDTQKPSVRRSYWDIVMGNPQHNYNLEETPLPKKSSICNYCNRSFGQVGNKNKHVRTVHLKMKPHPCPLCGKRFSQKSVQKNHLRAVHLGEKPFSCEICEKKFSDKNNFRKHVRLVHLKEKRYKCAYFNCIKKFGEKRSLNDHVSSVHEKKKPYRCEHKLCNARFGQKSHLSTHLKTRHSQPSSP